MYWFIVSHRDKKWTGHYAILADSLNVDREQPHFTIRKYLKEAIKELQELGMLAQSSKFISKDIVNLQMTDELQAREV
ncbi:hypothetical protein [Fundidesulfovibrio soli]|uniref:hypothetical protein n=1 Tax=Fundidesulfovibrio soli TaxID=2922716 RepID=UPI001FAF8896|nr:hypothetical protein [Fundidesulfovibrio soli]